MAVPTNIITGFLGVGKTTVILDLLKRKPFHERWAVLINEFGEVGVDGSIVNGKYSKNEGVFIREVPGGCMCCVAGLPMQIALNQLLARAKPDRLLIEPTGLGHPKEVLEVLSADHYREVLEIQQCITLVDARKISDSRYTSHDTFNQQIDMADIVVGHKMDLYDNEARAQLAEYVAKRRGHLVRVYFTQQGQLDIAVLQGKSTVVTNLKHHHHQHSDVVPRADEHEDLPECGFLKIENSGEGYRSVGWRFSSVLIFDRASLFSWLCGLKVERAKGVFITNEGIFGYNFSGDVVTELILDDCTESRIEIIFSDDVSMDEKDLLNCVCHHSEDLM